METGLTRNQILNELSRSAHGKLDAYVPIIYGACAQDPEFLAHLIAWDSLNGQIKDSKLALPVISLACREYPDELVENSLANLALQPPRELEKALRFSVARKLPARRQKALERMIWQWLEQKQQNPGRWMRLAIRHRRALHALYSLTRCRRPEWVGEILFESKYKPGSMFSDIANLARMEPAHAAATIQKWHLSPLVVSGAMSGAAEKQKDAEVVKASIDQMSDTEAITRAASLEKKGLRTDKGVKEAFRKKVAKATKSTKATLKTGVASEEVEDESVRTMLRELQERQIENQKAAGRGISGSWLVIIDKSQSQEAAIEIGKHIAAAICKFVSGRVFLAFCDTECAGTEVTGLTLEKIKDGTKFVRASGGTSYGVGLQWALQYDHDLDGVAIVGDGGENSAPLFAHTWHEYKRRKEKELPVYLYQTYCDPHYSMSAGGDPRNFERIMSGQQVVGYGVISPVQFTKHDLTHGQVDYYSLPNLVQSMGTNTFGVVDKIMACPLLTLAQVLETEVAAVR